MINDIEQKRIRAYSQADEHTKNLYVSTEIGFALERLFKEYAIPEDLLRTGIDIFGDAILGLFPKENIEEQLIEQIRLPESSAKDIIKELANFIARITTQESKGNTIAVSAPAPQIQQNQLAGEPRPLTREELMQKLSPRRTMVQDVASVQHPTASQPTNAPAQGYEAYQNKNVQDGG